MYRFIFIIEGRELKLSALYVIVGKSPKLSVNFFRFPLKFSFWMVAILDLNIHYIYHLRHRKLCMQMFNVGSLQTVTNFFL